jgi:hypothetical protein
VNAEGSFTLQTHDPQLLPTPVEGAPAGEYLVTVKWVPPDYAAQRNVSTPPDKLQGRYSDPQTSGLRVTVKAEPNDLPAFRLDVKAKADR